MPNEKLQIVNRKGSLLFEYTKEGQGPDELHYHSVLAVTKDRIYIHSLSAGIMIFDHRLNLLPESQNTRSLEKNIAMVRPSGVSLSDRAMIIYGHPFLEHHVFHYSLDDVMGEGIWQFESAAIEKKYPESGMKDPEIAVFHQGYLFTHRVKLFEDRNDYHVLVHKYAEGAWEPVTELTGTVEGLKSWSPSIKALVNDVLKIETGFVVQVAGAHPNPVSLRDHSSHYDIFDEKGVFQRRSTKINHQIITVTGSPLIFEIIEEDEEDVLVPFSF